MSGNTPFKAYGILRQYKKEDCAALSELFYETVHTVNSQDYSAEQTDAWTKSSDCLRTRQKDLLEQRTLIAEINGVVVGFGSIDKSGYLDLLFTHKDYQKRGIATAICDELERGFAEVKTFSSLTAKQFFINRGYEVIKEQEAERLGVRLKNFEMVRRNPSCKY